MSGLIFDICNNVKVNKKKSNLFLKWITIFLPYIYVVSVRRDPLRKFKQKKNRQPHD